MNRRTLDDWLRWLEALHPRTIELGLDRVRTVAARLGLLEPAGLVLTVGGTNGKGSCAAYLEGILAAAGYQVGAYTSPHLLRFNERIRLAGRIAGDEELVGAFARVEAARGTISLTYFEFTTLVAVELFRRADLDALVLEVGLGGRLDAVNLFDADVALITTVAIDHVDWLGDSLEDIGREKAGILRRGRPAVFGGAQPPRSLVERARALGVDLACAGRDFDWTVTGPGWTWRGRARRREHLPHPGIAGAAQHANAAAALMALELLAERVAIPDDAVAAGLAGARLDGRFQVRTGPVTEVLDVAHNVEAATGLAETLSAQPVAGRTHVVLAMLEDKDHDGVLAALDGVCDAWYLGGLDVPRGSAGAHLAARATALGLPGPVQAHERVQGAYRAAVAASAPGDRIVVCGSFFTVAAVLALETGRP